MSKAEEILQAVKTGYGEKLYWHIRRMVVSHDDAEDALQETFIKIFTKAHTFKGGSLESWCYAIATNEAFQLLRKRTHMFQSLDSVGPILADMVAAESAPDASQSAILFQKAVLHLSTQQRIVFNLRYYDDLPYDQIARITGKSEGTLRTNYHYAVDSIKKYLKENAL